MALTKRIDGTYTINASGIALVDDRNMTAGTGITQTATAIVKHSVVTFGTIIETTIIFSLINSIYYKINILIKMKFTLAVSALCGLTQAIKLDNEYAIWHSVAPPPPMWSVVKRGEHDF